MHGWNKPTQENEMWGLKLLPKFSTVYPTWREVVLKLKAPAQTGDLIEFPHHLIDLLALETLLTTDVTSVKM